MKVKILIALLFALIPSVNALEVDKDDLDISPSGQSIAIMLDTGVVVEKFVEGDGESPAREAGILIGDKIIIINGTNINNLRDVTRELKKDKDLFKIVLQRGSQTKIVVVKPLVVDGKNKIGVRLIDRIAGVGTLTYVLPEYTLFGSLGHSIDKGRETIEGEIKDSTIKSIKKGQIGKPGGKRAKIGENSLGKIIKNTDTGVYGNVTDDTLKNLPLMPIASRDEIKTGKAEIWTVIEGSEIEKFEIEIVKLEKQSEKSTKSMKIKITDERLLDKTGGIIQGMSGSPIIQNDKIIGAITHVLVNSPEMGYGIYIEWMLEDNDVFLT